jgi:hypothetical protein
MQETTINLPIETFIKLEALAKQSGVSRTTIINRLLDRIQNNITIDNYRMGTIQYQKSRPKDSWHCTHVYFSDTDFERCLDIRRILKHSLSMLITIAIEMMSSIDGPEICTHPGKCCRIFPQNHWNIQYALLYLPSNKLSSTVMHPG